METEKRTMVLVCHNVDCKSRGAEEIVQRLKDAFAGHDQVEVRTYMCFGTCHEGPNIVIYPQRHWYSGVQLSDVPELIQAIKNGTRVERICDKTDPNARGLIYNLLDAGVY